MTDQTDDPFDLPLDDEWHVEPGDDGDIRAASNVNITSRQDYPDKFHQGSLVRCQSGALIRRIPPLDRRRNGEQIPLPALQL